ncbi:MAG: recombinase RecA [Chloroflexi bacterium]|nr:recombinase RecA [Chloroflexota bacterium]
MPPKKERKQDIPPVQPHGQDEARQKALDTAITELTKRFGDGTVVRLGDAAHMMVDVIPTGSLGVDVASGVGGLPRGRITEIYGSESSGKTTLCLHVIAEAQKRGGLCAFIDMEHALDPTYAARLGVNMETLYVAQPDTGEQALEITETLVRSGALDVIVVDSVAALVPRAEIEGEMGDSHVGLQARLMSQALRKLSGAIKQSRVSVVFTNQLREKVGVMWGCFNYSTRITLADGSQEKIGKIVTQKKQVEVLSYNTRTRQFETRPIVSWFNNGNTDHFLQFTVRRKGGNGRSSFACTPNHLLLTEHGYQPADQLNINDNLVAAVKHYLSPLHMQVVMGSVLGDGYLKPSANGKVALRIVHGIEQDDYCRWKESLFAGLIGFSGTHQKGGHTFSTIPLHELTQLRQLSYGPGNKKAPSADFVQSLSPLAVAIWYMDDGTFDLERQNRCSICVTGLSNDKAQLLVDWFNQYGIYPKLDSRRRINFNVSETVKFHEMIARYVHPSMDYKLLPEMRGRFIPITADPCERLEPIPMPIIDIRRKPITRSMRRFDIEVEGNHCYVVDGVVVHNSPETTTGGRALKFYASVRLDIRRVESLKQGDEVIGNRTKVRVTKNKVAAPFREAEFDIMFYENGISKMGEIIDLGINLGLIEKRGAFLRYNDGLLGQGRENAKQFLRENPAVADEIEDQIRAYYGLPSLVSLPGRPAAAPSTPPAARPDGE